ncbi:pantetheine-phosphate adenylyltransferase family protein-like protein [Patellaria atrata CBS 101060]|uniref:Pantetheine-phosphate adenylyltransferase family protein-like protein n=1 Tax=Patellaria atrata CBS 101060 TaxID=1346257 RepID=A0A9P4SEV6_9PEZI|nr:pantetheine-phosphate adenylyltransferase family protein-like protein [Patellaria atrata CBS 101060]
MASSATLLLLSPAPDPGTFLVLKDLYGPALRDVLKKLSSSTTERPGKKILEVALPCYHLYGTENLSRSILYPKTQKLVAGLYKLICVIAAQESINVEDAEGIDARVLLIAHPGTDSPQISQVSQEMEGPVISLSTLALSGRQWHTIYSVDTELGEEVLKIFLDANISFSNVHKLRSGAVPSSGNKPSGIQNLALHPVRTHYSLAVGGTFDHLHIGHKLLLTMFVFALDKAPSSGEEPERSLTVGITGDALLKNKKFAEFLESWERRRESTHDFMSSILDFRPPGDRDVKTEETSDPGPNGHVVKVTFPSKLHIRYVEIWDPFGPTITDESITALIISAETRSGGKAVNDKRLEKGWPPLEVLEVDVLDPEDANNESQSDQETVETSFQNKLSSTGIRRAQSEKANPRPAQIP